jgi:hypothetical protein
MHGQQQLCGWLVHASLAWREVWLDACVVRAWRMHLAHMAHVAWHSMAMSGAAGHCRAQLMHSRRMAMRRCCGLQLGVVTCVRMYFAHGGA